jgi:hypothetical protein
MYWNAGYIENLFYWNSREWIVTDVLHSCLKYMLWYSQYNDISETIMLWGIIKMVKIVMQF